MTKLPFWIGAEPRADHGSDSGAGEIGQERMYQIVRQRGRLKTNFEIEFLDPGIEVFSFAFG